MIIDELKNREPFFLEVARKKVNGRRTWVCPNCGNGKGKDGDGISLDPNSKHSPHYKCFRCGLYGDVIDLFRYHKGFSDNSEAFREFCNYFGQVQVYHQKFAPLGESHIPSENSMSSVVEKISDSSEVQTSEVSRLVDQASKNIAKTNYHRGISLETLQRFKVGFVDQWRHPKAPNSPPSPRLIIPTSESSYLARSTVDNSKIKVGNVHIFNIDAIRTAQQPIFIVEGEIDALSIIDVGGEAIALGGISNIGLLIEEIISPTPGGQQAAADKDCLRQDILQTIRDEAQIPPEGQIQGPASRWLAQRNYAPSLRLVLALDNDRAGEEATEKLAEELRARNIPFYRADGLYGDFKDANEVLMHSR